jgi:hypothetical protein
MTLTASLRLLKMPKYKIAPNVIWVEVLNHVVCQNPAGLQATVPPEFLQFWRGCSEDPQLEDKTAEKLNDSPAVQKWSIAARELAENGFLTET